MATFGKELSVQQQLIMTSAIKGKLNKEIAEKLKMHPEFGKCLPGEEK